METSDIASLINEASRHNKMALETQLQPYNDLLFSIISSDIKTKHDDIMKELREKIQRSPGEIRNVDAYLWHYNVRYYHLSSKEYANKVHELPPQEQYGKMLEGVSREAIYDSNGWNWKIGAEFDGILNANTWQRIYDDLPMVPVDMVMRKTDLLARLSTLFHDYGWVEREVGKIIHEDETCVIRTVILKVHFYPKGVPGGYKTKKLEAAKTKYATHETYTVLDDHRVVLRGPGLEPPQTPPSTPKAPRRHQCPDCCYDSE